MTRKLKNYLITILSILAISLPVFLPATSLATCTPITDQITNGVGLTTGTPTTTCSTTTINTGIKNAAVTVVNILSIVVGVVAVIMIIYGGFRYITSGGESGSVSSAKNTLLFAIVGLVIVALAQVIVRWVIGTSTNIANSPPSGFIHLIHF